MAQATRATKALEQAGIRFELRSYEYDPDAESIGQAAASALGVEPAQVFKTLMVLIDGKPACAIAPSDGEVSMKRVAVVIDETALLWDAIFINGGQRGLQVFLAGEDAARVLDAAVADISAA